MYSYSFRRSRKRKEEEFEQVHPPDYITNPSKFPFNQQALLDVYEDVENNNKKVIENINCKASTYLQAGQFQKQLVEAKLNEMHTRKDKTRKHDNSQKNNIFKNESTKEENAKTYESGETSYVPLSGYHTWQAHDPKNMREKSKQFFTRDSVNDQSDAGASLQRQHSLPSKNSSDVHRVLPRAPSGPMYKSPDRSTYNFPSLSPKSRQICEPRDVHRKHEKSSQQRTPGKIKNNNELHTKTVQGKRYEENLIENAKDKTTHVRRQGSIENKRDNSHNTVNNVINRRSMPSITDLKLRSSVSISHKAQI